MELRRTHENLFWLFLNTKPIVTNKAEKVYEKTGFFFSFHVFFLSYGPQIAQGKSVKTIYLSASESTYYTISENSITLLQKMIYRGQSHSSWDIKD